MADDLTSIIERIKYSHKLWRFAMKQRMRNDLATMAAIRTILGFSNALPEKERNAITKKAAEIFKEGETYLAAVKKRDKAIANLKDGGEITAAIERPDLGIFWDFIESNAASTVAFELAEDKAVKELASLAKHLPVAPWAATVPGFCKSGFGPLGKIIGVTGNLSNYPNHRHVWKRLGLAPYKGRAMSKWKTGLTNEEYVQMGYSGQRRSQMYILEESLIGRIGRPAVGEDISQREDLTKYQKLFFTRMRYEAERDPEMARESAKEGQESFSLHCAMRARRVVAQEFIKDLYWEWRAATEPQRVAA